jgi:sulfhydrogenase subunit alpha
MASQQNIIVNYLARVEGQGRLQIEVAEGIVKDAKFGIFEPPRFFESFLVGRKYNEVHELTSRICGICQAPHQIASLRAIENALGLEISEQTRRLRRLLNFANHIQSHALNLYMLAAPDYLKYDSAISMTGEHLDLVKKALMLKKLGNDISEVVGGRAIHPVTALLGGFTQLPTKIQLEELKKRLQSALQDGLETIEIFYKLDIPDFERNFEQISLVRKDVYPINEGRLCSTEELDIDESEYRDKIEEKDVSHSWAKHSFVIGRDSFLVGPLARFNLNFSTLGDKSKKVAEQIGFKPTVNQPFKNLVARAIELLNCIEYSINIIESLIPLKDEIVVQGDVKPKAGVGSAITEAPRGILYHNFELDEKGVVKKADIVTPTAHNAANVENDLKEYVPTLQDLSVEEATLKCEMLVRAYDPCISCSVHMIKLE